MSADKARARLDELLPARWFELVSNGPIGRRSRTLSARTAARETSSLAQSHLRAQGATIPSADPETAGHGTAMRPDVAQEALALLSEDLALKRCPALVDGLRKSLTAVSHKDGNYTSMDVSTLNAFIGAVENSYIDNAIEFLCDLHTDTPNKIMEFESCVEQLVADLREREWSDESLGDLMTECLAKETTTTARLRHLKKRLLSAPRQMDCYVNVDLGGLSSSFSFADDAFSRVSEYPNFETDIPLPKKGSYIRIKLTGVDPRFVGRLARTRVAATLGAASVFLKNPAAPRSAIVIVDDADCVSAVKADLKLVRDPHNARHGQIDRIISSVHNARLNKSDAVFDAIRHHQRAIEIEDVESRYMLLWSAIERLCAGNRDASSILSASRGLVPKVLALGKLRREVASLANAIGEHLWLKDSDVPVRQGLDLIDPDGRKKIKHDVLLGYLLADEIKSREFTALFYEQNVVLTQWYSRLRRSLYGVDGTSVPARIASFIDDSRVRTEWQILRLYRARNWVAHGGDRPSWLIDLVRHSHYYLTNLIAIAVHRREKDPTRPAVDIYMERCGQYDAFISLLRAQDKQAMMISNLLRPTDLVGSP